jgi:phosphate-selective porin OprO and OprP
MGKSGFLAGSGFLALVLAAMPAAAQDGQPGNQTIEQRVQQLEQENAARRENEDALRTRLSTLEQSTADASWVFDYNRASIRTADGRFVLTFRGRFQFDVGAFLQDETLASSVNIGRDLHNGANFRRAQFGFEGRVYRDFAYEMVFDFGSSGTERAGQIYLMRVVYNPAAAPAFSLNLGAIQPKFTMDDSTSSADITFMERSSIVNTILDPFGGSDSRRGVEMLYVKQGMFHGSDNLLVSVAYTGERIAAVKTDDEGTQVLGRVAYRFYSDAMSNFQVGFDAARILNKPNRLIAANDRPETRIDGQQLVGFGAGGLPPAIAGKTAWLWGVEGGMNYGPFSMQGEYYRYGIDRTVSTLKDPEFGGWYVQASYFLTGEMRPYVPASAAFGSPPVANAFALDASSWGAWEVKARYSVNDFNAFENDAVVANRVLGGEQKIISAGVNWYLNRNIRWMFDYMRVDIDRMNTAGAQAGQKFGVLATRIQFSF